MPVPYISPDILKGYHRGNPSGTRDKWIPGTSIRERQFMVTGKLSTSRIFRESVPLIACLSNSFVHLLPGPESSIKIRPGRAPVIDERESLSAVIIFVDPFFNIFAERANI